MLKQIALTTAFAALATGGFAQTAPEPENGKANDLSTAILASNIIDANLLRVEGVDVDAEPWFDTLFITDVDFETNDVGELTDVIMNEDGSLKAVVAEVGGFLDIGDKSVMLPLDKVRLYRMQDGSITAYTNLTEDELVALPELPDNE